MNLPEFMLVSPTCCHYLRRLLKRAMGSVSVVDLIESASASVKTLDDRLHYLYPHSQRYSNVALHIETLVCSHQAHYADYQNTLSLDSLSELERIATQLFWWLGYDVSPKPSLVSGTEQPTVFLVEDTLEIIQLVAAVLDNQNYGFNSALSGELALEMIQENPPDLILLDIKLPDMDGCQVYQHLQSSSLTQNIPVIFLTALSSMPEEQQRLCHRVGYLHKPFKSEVLLEKIGQYLNPDPVPSRFETARDSSRSIHRRPNETFSTIDEALQERRDQALRLSPNVGTTGIDLGLVTTEEGNVQGGSYFFRVTLEGRYLRVTSAFAHLCGYASATDMVAQVGNVWTQIYSSQLMGAETGRSKTGPDHWRSRLQHPNQFYGRDTQIYDQFGQVIDVWEQICLIEDESHHRLFYQGYIYRKPSVMA